MKVQGVRMRDREKVVSRSKNGRGEREGTKGEEVTNPVSQGSGYGWIGRKIESWMKWPCVCRYRLAMDEGKGYTTQPVLRLILEK
jgi:hypothetical protein